MFTKNARKTSIDIFHFGGPFYELTALVNKVILLNISEINEIINREGKIHHYLSHDHGVIYLFKIHDVYRRIC